jgi:hypothetical protein
LGLPPRAVTLPSQGCSPTPGLPDLPNRRLRRKTNQSIPVSYRFVRVWPQSGRPENTRSPFTFRINNTQSFPAKRTISELPR